MTTLEAMEPSRLLPLGVAIVFEYIERAGGFYQTPGFWEEIALPGADGRRIRPVPQFQWTCRVPA